MTSITNTIVVLSLAYAVLGVVLLVMGLRSPWKWWIKATAIVMTSAFFIVAFYKTRELQGWPIVAKMPERFQLLWVRVLEPNRAYQEPGAIFMWVEALDENNVPSGTPRSYKLRYTQPMAEKAEKAKEQIMQGNQLEGTAQDMAGTTAVKATRRRRHRLRRRLTPSAPSRAPPISISNF